MSGTSHSISQADPWYVKGLLITIALLFLALFLVLPLGVVFAEAFRRGIDVYIASITDPEALAAVRLTLGITAASLVCNLAFGLCVGWACAYFRFWGRPLLVTLIDLPYAISPVIAGFMYILVYGVHGIWGDLLARYNLTIIFAWPGILLATLFVTLPFIAREILPFLEEVGTDDAVAARTLGASGWQIFLRVTLPNMRWALLYGIILSVARALGEFGAVAVVSGHIRGKTHTLPLQVEVLYNEYNYSAAFAVASLLTSVAVVTLIIKAVVERHVHQTRMRVVSVEEE